MHSSASGRTNARMLCGSQAMTLPTLSFHRVQAGLPVRPAMLTGSSLATRIARLGRALLACALVVPLMAPGPAAAQQRSVPVVRDAEIEAVVRDYARPILKAAGLSGSNIGIVLVNDKSFNAFVAGRRMFINTGALVTSETPNEIIGVIAHEAGHIAGGHQERLREQLARAQTMAIVGALLGLGAAVAGAATDAGGLAQAGGGLAMAGGEMARRGLLGYQRSEEITADRSALTYLQATGQSAKSVVLLSARQISAEESTVFARWRMHISRFQMSNGRMREYPTFPINKIVNSLTDSAECAFYRTPDRTRRPRATFHPLENKPCLSHLNDRNSSAWRVNSCRPICPWTFAIPFEVAGSSHRSA